MRGVPLTVNAPLSGVIVPITDVPDPVFAGQMVGSGVGVLPSVDGVFDVVAPVSGKIVKLLPHAFVIVDAAGRGILTHVGIDTVKLKGEGFELLSEKGAQVVAGDAIMRVDPGPALAAGYSLVSPVVVLDSEADTAEPLAQGDIAAGDPLFSWSPGA